MATHIHARSALRVHPNLIRVLFSPSSTYVRRRRRFGVLMEGETGPLARSTLRLSLIPLFGWDCLRPGRLKSWPMRCAQETPSQCIYQVGGREREGRGWPLRLAAGWPPSRLDDPGEHHGAVILRFEGGARLFATKAPFGRAGHHAPSPPPWGAEWVAGPAFRQRGGAPGTSLGTSWEPMRCPQSMGSARTQLVALGRRRDARTHPMLVLPAHRLSLGVAPPIGRVRELHPADETPRDTVCPQPVG